MKTFLPRKMDRTPFTVLPRFPPRVVHRPYITLAVLQILDVGITYVILRGWSARAEGNPLAAAVFDGLGLEVGAAVFLLFKLAAVGLFYATQFPIRLASALYGLVLLNNVLFLILWAHLALTT